MQEKRVHNLPFLIPDIFLESIARGDQYGNSHSRVEGIRSTLIGIVQGALGGT